MAGVRVQVEYKDRQRVTATCTNDHRGRINLPPPMQPIQYILQSSIGMNGKLSAYMGGCRTLHSIRHI